jgi:S1-C subfamily serine protease
LLDVGLIVLAAAFAVAGYRQGFIIGILSFGGFICGALAGVHFAHGLSVALTNNQNLRAVMAIIFVFVAAVGGMLLASAVGVMIRSRVKRRPTTTLDAIGGAIVNVVAVLLLAWLIGTIVASATPSPAIATEVRDSIVLGGVKHLIPPPVQSRFSAFGKLLSTSPYAQVFGTLGTENALDLPKPDRRVLRSTGLAVDRQSVVKIEGVAPSCSRTIEGSGFAIGRHRVITNAHVVAGVTSGPEVYVGLAPPITARVILFDPKRDIAVLYVPGLNVPGLRLAGPAGSGADAIVAGYPLDAAFTAVPARMDKSELANSPDIYNKTRLIRDIYPIRAVVRPGNSGGPLIAPDGRIYGMVFAAGVQQRGTGYALTSSEIAPDIRLGEQRAISVSTESCQ